MIPKFYKCKSIDGDIQLNKVSKSTTLVLEQAEKCGVAWEKIPYTGLFKLKYKGKVKYFHARIPSETTELAYYICTIKRVTNSILTQAGVSVSKGYLIQNNDDKQYCLELYRDMQKPIVVKPLDSSLGKNVYLHINSQNKYLEAIKKIRLYNGRRNTDILMEEMFAGEEYRILATQKKILSVIRRVTANVVGDGKSMIEELIRVKNADPIRRDIPTYHEITIDEVMISFLKTQNLKLESIVEKDNRVFLLPKSPYDVGIGGDTIDVTDQIDSSVVKIVHKIMQSIPGLALVGIDFMSRDIYKKQTSSTYRVIELNTSPCLDWNEYPIEGPHRPVAYEFLKIMFPNLK